MSVPGWPSVTSSDTLRAMLPQVLITAAAAASGGLLAERRRVEVAAVAASFEDAARRVAEGEADGILDVTPEGWALLVLPAGGAAGPSERADLAAALTTTATTAMAAADGLTGPADAASLLVRTAIRQSMAERRQRGQRVGPRPIKPPRRLIEDVIDQQRDPMRSLRAIADALNERGEPTLKGTGKWHPASVKRLIDGRRAETRIVLRRLTGLLIELQQSQPVDDDELARLGVRHGFHHHRLWLAFERGFGHPYCSGLIPPVEKTPSGYVVSRQGAELLRIWKRSEELDDALQPFCLEIEDAGGALDPQAYGAICAEHQLDASDVPPGLVEYDTANGRFTLTSEGHDVAQVWLRLRRTIYVNGSTSTSGPRRATRNI